MELLPSARVFVTSAIIAVGLVVLPIVWLYFRTPEKLAIVVPDDIGLTLKHQQR